MPRMRKKDDVVAIFCSDLHLSHRAPIARSTEPDWYEVMRRSLEELGELQDEHECPIFYAGDIFDHWNMPPELVNFALNYLPSGYIIPGQHELPNHSLGEIRRSAFATLTQAANNRFTFLANTILYPISDRLYVSGFPWGVPLGGVATKKKDAIYVAVCHRYVWTKGLGYPGAPTDHRIKETQRALEGYDLAVFGDNHKSFYVKSETHWPSILNCGCMIPRKIDEKEYEPSVWLMLGNGAIKRHKLSTADNKWLKVTGFTNEDVDMSQLVKVLEDLGDGALDFPDMVKKAFHGNESIRRSVRRIILHSLEAALLGDCP